MDKVPSIVQGEASESDSDDEIPIGKCIEDRNDTSLPHAVVVAGEAPESDEEQNIPKVTEAITQEPSSSKEKQNSKVMDSLLHKKLIECNGSLHNNVKVLLKSTIQESLAQLASAEQQLLKSQMRVQRASASVRTLSTSSAALANKLSSTLSASYIPKINISL